MFIISNEILRIIQSSLSPRSPSKAFEFLIFFIVFFPPSPCPDTIHIPWINLEENLHLKDGSYLSYSGGLKAEKKSSPPIIFQKSMQIQYYAELKIHVYIMPPMYIHTSRRFRILLPLLIVYMYTE